MEESTQALFDAFADQRLVVIGDVMLDRFIWGSVSRISPEAPVPVVEVQRESFYPGGAANVARNLTPFGVNVDLVGFLGTDENGQLLRRVLDDNGIAAGHLVELDGFTTIAKTRVVARQQQVVRIDRERKTRPTENQVAQLAAELRELAPSLDGIIIEDYGKGLITQALVDEITAIAKDAGVIVTVDPNPKNPIHWSGVSTVKPNRIEAFQEAGIEDSHDGSPPLEDPALLEVGQRLLEKWESENVLITLGEQGMLLVSHDRDPFHIPTRAQEVFDVSGAGDTAIAVFTLALCAGADPRTAADLSNHASGIVVGKLGTTPIERDELVADLENRAAS